jgi:ribonuclease D
MVITRPQELDALVSRVREHDAFALDTEFERERTFWPRLQLIQVGIPGEEVAVDPLALSSLTPLFDLIVDPSIQKITHAGKQDAEIFFNRIGAPPANLYDTQIAAALVGYGEQVGYANLVNRLLQVRLKKVERVTDWGRRPLTDSQVEYALGDVRTVDFYAQDPRTMWRRVSGWRGLDKRGLGLLRELTVWRDNQAQTRDVPRNRVVADDVLVEIASRRPTRIADLTPLRRLHPREIERSGNAILDAVKTGMEISESDLPEVPRPPREDADAALVGDLMGVLLKKRAREHRIATTYLGNSKAVSALVTWLSGPRAGETPPLLSGWRNELVGEELVALFEGRMSLHVSPDGRRVETTTEEPSD